MGWSDPYMTAPIGLGDISSAVNVGPVSGTQYDLGYMIANGNIEAWAKYKPVYHPAAAYVTLDQRKAIFHGFTPVNMTHIINNHIGAGGGTTSATGTFTSVPTPSAWTYTKPSGGIGTAPYRTFDFLHIEGNTSQIQSANGYYKDAKPPIYLKTTTADIDLGSTKAPVDYDLFVFDENGSSINTSGNTAGIEIKFDELLPKTSFPNDNYDEPIFLEGGSRTFSYTWQFAIAVACKVSSTNYAWVIVSSELPFGDYWTDVNWSLAQLFQHRICFGSDMAAGAYGIITNAIRNYGQTDFTCIPIIAQNLYYNSSTGVWYFAVGSSSAKALTFPKGDYFTATFSGITSNMTLAPQVGYLYYTIGGTTYNILFGAGSAYTGFLLTVPYSMLANNNSATLDLRVQYNGFGRNVGFQGGINGQLYTTTLYDLSGNVITEIGSAGQDPVQATFRMVFSDSVIPTYARQLPTSITQMDVQLSFQWINADTGKVVKRNYPLRVMITR